MINDIDSVAYSKTDDFTQDENVTKLIEAWENWMIRFKGVATKYLRNYLHWFDYLENSMFKKDKKLAFIRLLLQKS